MPIHAAMLLRLEPGTENAASATAATESAMMTFLANPCENRIAPVAKRSALTVRDWISSAISW